MAKRSVRVSDNGVVAPHEDASRRFPRRIIITISEELGVIADKQTARFKRGREHAWCVTSLPRKKTRTIIRSPQAQRHKLSIAVDVTTRALRHPNRFGTVLFDDSLHFALDDVIRFIPGDALEGVLSPVFLSSFHRVSQAVFVIQHLLERQTTRAKTALVVRVLRIALDFFEHTILHVHKNAAVVVAAWARSRVRANNGIPVLLPCPFATRWVILCGAHQLRFLPVGFKLPSIRLHSDSSPHLACNAGPIVRRMDAAQFFVYISGY